MASPDPIEELWRVRRPTLQRRRERTKILQRFADRVDDHARRVQSGQPRAARGLKIDVSEPSGDQCRIDAIRWHHEFDFPTGSRARADAPDVAFHRTIWRSFAHALDRIDFTGQSVLEIGYWSCDAERRGARSVLATDDQTQELGREPRSAPRA